jgi:hypothetical protein
VRHAVNARRGTVTIPNGFPGPRSGSVQQEVVVNTRKRIGKLLVAGLVLAGTFLLLVAAAQGQRGMRVRQQNLAEMVSQAEYIVRGRVVSVVSEPHPLFNNIWTVAVTLDVLESLKGDPGPRYTFRQFVNDVRDRESRLGYKLGEEVLLLLIKPSRYGLSSPAGLEQGRFRITLDARGNRLATNGAANLGLFQNLAGTSPKTAAELRLPLRQLVQEHRSGPVTYEQLREMIVSLVAGGGQ